MNMKKIMTKHDSPNQGELVKKVFVNPKTEKTFAKPRPKNMKKTKASQDSTKRCEESFPRREKIKLNSDQDVIAAQENRNDLRMVNSTEESRNPNLNTNSKWCQESTIKSTNFKAKKIFFETYMKRGDNFYSGAKCFNRFYDITNCYCQGTNRSQWESRLHSTQGKQPMSSLQKLTKAGPETRV
jgi:hypothetical protein